MPKFKSLDAVLSELNTDYSYDPDEILREPELEPPQELEEDCELVEYFLHCIAE